MESTTPALYQEGQLHQEITTDAVPILELIEAMRVVDLNDPEATLNATTISDGKGGRILL